MSGHTPGPWELGSYNEYLGYDCMTGGIRVGPVVLDAGDYGQRATWDHEAWERARMEADARLIHAAPILLASLKGLLSRYVRLVDSGDAGFWNPEEEDEVIAARSAIAEAEKRDV